MTFAAPSPVLLTSSEPAQPMQGLPAGDNAQHLLGQHTGSELQLLELLAANAPMSDLLQAYALSFEANFPGVLCSVLLMDNDGLHLRHGAAPSLPEAFCQAVDGEAIGPAAGSCGTAAFTRQTVVVSDIATDPLWKNWAGLALSHGLQACWSVPILSTQGQVLGTFANYHHTVRVPRTDELQSIQRSAYLLGLTIEHHRIKRDMALQARALRESEARYRTLVEWSPHAVAVHRAGRMIYVNEACIKLLRAASKHDLLGKSIAELMHPDSLAIALQRAEQAMSQGVDGALVEEKLRRLDGSFVEVEVQNTAIMYDGEPAVYVVAHDLSQRRQDEETIHQLAFVDTLTSLPNRRLMLDRLQQALVSSDRTQQYGALLLLDLDNFKRLNDLLGHHVGDALLQQAAQRLQTCVRKSDSVGRVGGDEFMVLLDTLTTSPTAAAQHAETVAQKMLATLSEPYRLADQTMNNTTSIGVVVFAQGDQNHHDVVKNVEAAMYQAKGLGRNTACFFDPTMQAQALHRAAFEQDMRLGLERHEFILHYQIQVNTQGEPTGAEALVRWQSPTHGMVSPLAFIGLAEENGMILTLGQQVLVQACAQLVRWSQDPRTAHWMVAVNVSARQFAHDEFVVDVLRALETTGANPQRLKLELTESMLVKNAESVIARMNAIKALGVSFSLDDFGTGYSSLSYLKRLPLSQLKIDQSFVRDLLTNPNDAVIARTIINLGHSLGMRVIAEGVETPEQRHLLANMGCDAFQGYFFGHPGPADQLIKHLEEITL